MLIAKRDPLLPTSDPQQSGRFAKFLGDNTRVAGTSPGSAKMNAGRMHAIFRKHLERRGARTSQHDHPHAGHAGKLRREESGSRIAASHHQRPRRRFLGQAAIGPVSEDAVVRVFGRHRLFDGKREQLPTYLGPPITNTRTLRRPGPLRRFGRAPIPEKLLDRAAETLRKCQRRRHRRRQAVDLNRADGRARDARAACQLRLRPAATRPFAAHALSRSQATQAEFVRGEQIGHDPANISARFCQSKRQLGRYTRPPQDPAAIFLRRLFVKPP